MLLKCFTPLDQGSHQEGILVTQIPQMKQKYLTYPSFLAISGLSVFSSLVRCDLDQQQEAAGRGGLATPASLSQAWIYLSHGNCVSLCALGSLTCLLVQKCHLQFDKPDSICFSLRVSRRAFSVSKGVQEGVFSLEGCPGGRFQS